MEQNSRRFSRIFFGVRARLEIKEQVFTLNRIANLSIGGCLLEVHGEFPPKTPCRFIVLLDRMAPGLEIDGEVVRGGDAGLAIQFTGISPEGLFHLRNIIRYNAEDPEQIEDEISSHPGLK